MLIQWSTEKLKQWRGEIERENNSYSNSSPINMKIYKDFYESMLLFSFLLIQHKRVKRGKSHFSGENKNAISLMISSLLQDDSCTYKCLENIRSLVGNVKVQELAKQKPKFSCHKKKFSFRGLTVGCLAEVWQMMSSRGRTVVQPSVARLDSQTEARHLPDRGQTAVRPRNGFLRGHGERLRFFNSSIFYFHCRGLVFPFNAASTY